MPQDLGKCPELFVHPTTCIRSEAHEFRWLQQPPVHVAKCPSDVPVEFGKQAPAAQFQPRLLWGSIWC